jgi:excinuclease ABC subunit A
MWTFDPGKIIVNSAKPLFGGALAAELDLSYPKWTIESLARKRQIKLATPFRNLTEAERTILLEGDSEGREGVLQLLLEKFNRSYAEEREILEPYMSLIKCKQCQGKRLRAASLAVRLKGLSIADFTAMPISRALLTVRSWEFTDRETQIVGRLVGEIRNRLEFLAQVGLDYLSLDRSAATISGGEGQRIRLATQIGSKLRGVLYVLDEPSIGLHPRDNERLLQTLTRLRDMGNTVLVVEHDAETIERADYVVDLGPGAGRLGGHVVATGDPRQIARNPNSLTGQYLSGVKEISSPAVRRVSGKKKISIVGAREHNLKDINVEIPLGLFTVVTGVSGSGKSTLVNDILFRALAREIYGSGTHAGDHEDLHGAEHIDKVIRIDQSPIGRTPRSNPATYTGLFTPIRDLYAMLPESRERGYKPGPLQLQREGRAMRGLPG